METLNKSNNLYYINYFCEKCNANHFLLFTKNNDVFMELEDLKKPKIIKECKINTKGFIFEGAQKFRFDCDSTVYLNFKNGVFKGFGVAKYFTEVCKDLTVIEE